MTKSLNESIDFYVRRVGQTIADLPLDQGTEARLALAIGYERMERLEAMLQGGPIEYDERETRMTDRLERDMNGIRMDIGAAMEWLDAYPDALRGLMETRDAVDAAEMVTMGTSSTHATPPSSHEIERSRAR